MLFKYWHSGIYNGVALSVRYTCYNPLVGGWRSLSVRRRLMMKSVLMIKGDNLIRWKLLTRWSNEAAATKRWRRICLVRITRQRLISIGNSVGGRRRRGCD